MQSESRALSRLGSEALENCWSSCTPSATVSFDQSRLVELRRVSEGTMKPEYDFSKGKRGAVIPQKGKTRISIFIDNAVLAEFRARAEKTGSGYQTMMNEALRTYLSQLEQPVTEKMLRQVLRQEMPEYLRGLTTRSSGRNAAVASGSRRRRST
jgi:uncharacterized protein (DUF4415 family)